MIVENLNLGNILEQICNDREWMHQMIYGNPEYYSDEARDKARSVKRWLDQNPDLMWGIAMYIKMREDLLKASASTKNESKGPQIDMFND